MHACFAFKKQKQHSRAWRKYNEERLNEVWLAQSCFVAKWDFSLYWFVWHRLQDKQDTQHHKYLFMIIMSLILNVLFYDEMSLSKFNHVLFLTNNHILGYPDYFI